MMKVYTRTGDSGKTSIFGGERVFKDDALVDANGTIDELNAILGVAKAHSQDTELVQIIENAQDDLFTIGAELASMVTTSNNPKITQQHVDDLEKTIDEIQSKLTEQKTFIIPGGTKEAAFLQLGRTIARRAERRLVTLSKNKILRPELLKYVNRLSDLLHVLSRHANKEQTKEQQPIYKYFEK